MAEPTSIISRPFIEKLVKSDGGIRSAIYYAVTTGNVDSGNFKPPGNDTTAQVEIYSRVSEAQYNAAKLRNPDLVNTTSDGQLVVLTARIQNGKITPTSEATQEELQNIERIRTSSIGASVDSIITDERKLNDKSNLTPNVETITPGVGANALAGTPPENKPSERGGDSRPATSFSYQKIIKSDGNTILYYPQNIADDQDKIEFSVWQYKQEGRSIDNPNTNILSFGFKPGGDEYSRVNTQPTIYLPISNKIMDSNGVTWNEESFNELQRIAAQMSLALMQQSNQSQSQNTESAETKFANLFNSSVKSTQLGNAARTWLAGKAVGATGLLTRATGAAINPNLELLFQSPQLRAFQFQFLLIGKSERESKIIKKIIRFFKKNMAVRTNTVSLEKSMTPTFLNSPYVFGIRYLKGQGDHPSINKIKKCALQNFSVDYTPMGSYMTYNDTQGSMFMYSISMQFKELTPIYDIDYPEEKDSRHPIGY